MKFGPVPVQKLKGSIVGHSHHLEEQVIRKGTVLDDSHIEIFERAGFTEVVVAVLEEDDIVENIAAQKIARLLCGSGVEISKPIAGRCNIRSSVKGVLDFDSQKLEDLNVLDWRVTVASKHRYSTVQANQVIATIKIIPYAIPQELMDQIMGMVSELFAIMSFQKHRAAMVVSYFNQISDNQRQRSIDAQSTRLQDLGSSLDRVVDCEHRLDTVADSLSKTLEEGWDLVLFSGACAVADEEDVFPAAIRKIGGVVRHIGMPVEPGNMLVWGEVQGIPVIGIPGCARSSKKSGLDWVLERILSDISFEPRDIMRMGVGGLLSSPNRSSESQIQKLQRVGAVVLMAGLSTRMPETNKLLVEIDGVSMASRCIQNISEAGYSPIIVVTGYEDKKIKDALREKDVFFMYNESFREGMGSSIQKAFEGICGWDGALIAMGDMPFVSVSVLQELRETFEGNSESIIAPVRRGKRGQPVIFSSRFFAELQSKCSGDVGARVIIKENQQFLHVVEVEHEGIFWDIDTGEDIQNMQREFGNG